MNVKTTIALVGLLIAIGAYFYFVEMDATDPRALGGGDTPSIKGEPLLPEDFPSPIEGTSFTIERDGQTTVYRHLDQGWMQTDPVRFAMNSGTIERLVGDVLQLRYTQRLTPGGPDAPTLVEARLDPPLATVTYAADDDTATLYLGKKLLGGYAYVTLNDDPTIHVVADRLHNRVLDTDLNQWRQRTLDAPEAETVDRVTIREAGHTITLYRADDRWWVDSLTRQRADSRADRSAVDALLAGVAGVAIDRFHADAPDDLSLYGLDKPARVVTLRDAATGRSSVLTIGGPTDLSHESAFAIWMRDDDQTPPVVFSVPVAAFAPFEVKIDALREPRLLDLDALETRVVTIERDGMPTLALERDTSGPKFGEPDPGYDVDLAAATAFIDDMTGMTSDQFVPGFKPAGESIARVELLRRGTGSETAAIYRDGDRYVALRGGESVGYVLTDEQVELLRTPRLALRDRVVVDIPPDTIERLTLSYHGETQTFVREGDRFALEGEGDADPGRIGSLVAMLNPLYAESWPTPPQGSITSAAAPATLTIETTASAVPFELGVDRLTRNARFTGVRGQGIDDPFVLPRETVDLMTGRLGIRSLLSVASDAIETIRIEQDGDYFTLRRGTDGTIIADKAEHLPTIDQEMATKLFEAIAGLEVDRGFEASAVEPVEGLAVLALTVTPAEGEPQAFELWTQDNRMFTRAGGGRAVALTGDSAEALAFLFALPEQQ